MSRSNKTSGPQFRADRPAEQEAVRTTIVGGRPPGSGKPLGAIPRGIDVLVKKASVDPEFRGLLLEDRATAARQIALTLDPAETAMLAAVPREQLETIIARTRVPEEHRRVFLGKVAAAMLATLGIATAGCPRMEAQGGARPIEVPERAPEKPEPAAEPPDPEAPVRGIRPDRVPVTDGIRPDPPPTTKGIRPDLPPGTE